jgi:hypothetical protein
VRRLCDRRQQARRALDRCGTWPAGSRGRNRYPRLPPLVLCRRPADPPRPDGDPDDPRSLLYDALGRVPVVSSPPPDLSRAVAFLSRPRRLPAGWSILERVIDKRPQADRILVATISGEVEHRAKRRELTADEEAAAVAALRQLAGGRADLLAEAADLCRKAGPAWRRYQGGSPRGSGGLHGGGVPRRSCGRFAVSGGMRFCFFVEEPAGRDLLGAGT